MYFEKIGRANSIQSWLVVPWYLLDVMNLVKFQNSSGRNK